MNHQTIIDKYNHFAKTTGYDDPEIGENQVKDMKRIFFSGFAEGMMCVSLKRVGKGEEVSLLEGDARMSREEAMEHIKRWRKECIGFLQSIQEGLA